MTTEDAEKMKKLAAENFERILDMWKETLSLGQRLLVFRQLFGAEQAPTAERLGLSTQFYARMERGEQKPGADALARIREFFGADLNILYDSLKGREEE